MVWAKGNAMFFRVTRAGRYQYVQIARSYRDGGTTKQQTLLSLGRLDVLQASGQLDALLRSGLRLSERLVVLDAHAAGETDAVRLRKIGPDLVFGRLWDETGIAQALNEQLAGRRYEFDVERAIYLTVLHRLFVSGSDRAAESWREDYRIPGVEDTGTASPVSSHGVPGRSRCPNEAERAGSPRCVKDVIEEALFAAAPRSVHGSGPGVLRHDLDLLRGRGRRNDRAVRPQQGSSAGPEADDRRDRAGQRRAGRCVARCGRATPPT